MARRSGHGLMLLMVFLSTAVMTIVSLQMMQVNTGLGAGIQSNSHVKAYDLTMSAFAVVREDILSKIDAGTFNPATYTYTGSISIPDDPSNLAGSATPAGSFTATIPQYNGNTYLIQITGTSGTATATLKDILEIAPSPAQYSCAVEGAAVEAAVFANTLASVSNADLIAYAQNNCMIKTATVPGVAAPVAATGTTDCTSNTTGTSSGSGILNRRTISSSCEITVSGDYTDIRLTTLTGNGSGLHLTYNGIQTVDIDTVSSSGWVNASSTATGKIFRFNTITSSYSTQRATAGNDFISVFGLCDNCKIRGENGNDIIVMNGDSRNDAIIEGDCDPSSAIAGCTTAGDDTIYIRSMTEVSAYGEVYGYNGADKIYFDSSYGGEFRGGGGDDLIVCTGIFGSPCGLHDYGTFTYGNAGNDTIIIDTAVTDGSWIEGGTGANIIYFKGMSSGGNGTSYVQANTSTSPVNQLVILAGNTSGGNITAYGSNNVLLIKTGVTTGSTTLTGWARTIYY